MNAVKKICNFFGILLAWVLSIAFIAVLVAAPITLTLLSAVQPKKASEMVSYIDTSTVDLSQFLPLEQEEKELTAAVQELFNSDAAKKVVELYMTDVYNALTGEETETLLTADALVDVVDEYMEDLVQIVQKYDLNEGQPVQEIREQIRQTVKDEAETILAELPSPKEMVQEMVEENPQLQDVFRIVAQKDKVEMAFVVVLVVLALLILGCRFPGYRGIRWLATDMFIATAFLALQSIVVVGGASLIDGILSLTPFRALAAPMVAILRNGMIFRTGAVLAVAFVLIVVYSKICDARLKKQRANMQNPSLGE